MPYRPADIVAACEAAFPTWHSDCSGFAKAVAHSLEVALSGNADQIMSFIRANWLPLSDGLAAAQAAKNGAFIIGGLTSGELVHHDLHGHVVVVIAGQLVNDIYPLAYWGQLGGEGARQQGINWAFNKLDLPKVTFHAAPSDA